MPSTIILPTQPRVGIKGHAVAEVVAEAPKRVARALLYIVRASPFLLPHGSGQVLPAPSRR